ncbi:hypothetical protein [Phenylobacterium sp.]|uniref:hypothetical protein n=1 Tax=Phenylobacterium sp. TaxID=1871053 RepID=UPI002FDF79EC
MARRNDTAAIGDLAEAEAARLLTELGWAVTNLNAVTRNHRLYDLKASREDREVMVSVKHARAKRHIRLGAPTVFRDLRDEDVIIIFMPPGGRQETDIAAGAYEVWVVPGSARHTALDAHLHYYGGDEALAASQNSMMIKDKIDRPGGRSISGAAFHAWRSAYRDGWTLLA